MTESFTLLKSDLIYEGSIISLYVDKIKSPEGRVMEREVVKHLDAVGIVAINKRREIVFVKQYRHAIDADLLEIPAGLLDNGENPKECAVRELREETGYRAGTVHRLAEFYTSAGFTDERFYLFFTDEIEEGEPERDEGEEGMLVEHIPVKEAVEMVASGKIEDAKTLTAILMAAQRVGRIEV
ncbi:MAG: NUDIX hydrolase [Candidatus Aquicultor sp.]